VKTLATRRRLLEILRDERGFTLTEMMTTTMIMLVVLLALFGIFDMSLKVFSYGNNKVEAVESARVGMEKMEREIRQAYAPSGAQMFDTWTSTQIRFGNDLDGNGVIACPNSTGRCEKIGYRLNGTTLGRDNTSAGTTNTVANLQPVAEHVQSLTFTYYDRNGNVVVPGVDPDGVDNERRIDRVLISMEVSVDEGIGRSGTQTLTSVVDLRNR
jgi:prepilin-type N-terminal cleavage/methylation domain-containing protein